MKTATTLLTAAILTTALPARATAADLLYTLKPIDGAGYSATWLMAAKPLPTQVVEGQGFAIERVTGTFPRTTEGDAYLDFFFASNGGGLVISDADGPRVLATLFGAQLYSGGEAAPTMRIGDFTLTSDQRGGRRYSLAVINAPAAVPEPSTWMLMIAGFGMVGAALRRRYRVEVRYVDGRAAPRMPFARS